MAEQEPSGINFRYADITPIEQVTNADGTAGTILEVHATDEKTAEVVREQMEKFLGGPIKKLSDKDARNRSFFASNWENCKWEPQGPKSRPPQDPSKN